MSTSAAREPGSEHLEVAAAHADLGLPVPRGARFRSLKRLLGRLMWVFGRNQATYNHAMLETAGELANAIETMRTTIPERVGNEVGSMRSQVGALEVEVRELQARVLELTALLSARVPHSDAPTRSS